MNQLWKKIVSPNGRLELEIVELPRWRDAVEVTTWPSRLRSFFVVRDFLVRRPDGTTLARATSTWFVIDLIRRRAVRVPRMVRDIPLPERDRALQESWAKLPRPKVNEMSRRCRIRRADLDVNTHVNNVRYVEWSLETLPLDFFDEHRLARLEIDFLAELNYGSSVITTAQRLEGEDGTVEVLFSVADDGGSEAARMRSRWVDVSSG